jgi:hypothetical protein
MRALRAHHPGRPEVLRIEEIPRPTRALATRWSPYKRKLHTAELSWQIEAVDPQ